MVNNPDTYLTAAEVARALRLQLGTVRRLLRGGRIPGRRVGRSWRTRAGDLADYIAGRDAPKPNGIANPTEVRR